MKKAKPEKSATEEPGKVMSTEVASAISGYFSQLAEPDQTPEGVVKLAVGVARDLERLFNIAERNPNPPVREAAQKGIAVLLSKVLAQWPGKPEQVLQDRVHVIYTNPTFRKIWARRPKRKALDSFVYRFVGRLYCELDTQIPKICEALVSNCRYEATHSHLRALECFCSQTFSDSGDRLREEQEGLHRRERERLLYPSVPASPCDIRESLARELEAEVHRDISRRFEVFWADVFCPLARSQWADWSSVENRRRFQSGTSAIPDGSGYHFSRWEARLKRYLWSDLVSPTRPLHWNLLSGGEVFTET